MPDAPAGGGGGGLSRRVGGIPLGLWLAAGGVLVGGVWYVRRKNAAAAAAAASGTSLTGTGAATTPYGPPSYGYQGTGIDPSTLAAILASQGGGSTAQPVTPSSFAGETLWNQGYYVPGSTDPLTDAQGNTYEWVQNPAQAKGLKAQGATFYYQPIPGVFSPLSPGIAAPAYVKIPTAGGTLANPSGTAAAAQAAA